MEVVGIGIDLEEIDSFRKRPPALYRRFYDRVFSAPEIAYCRKFRDPSPRFATRYCAKEALVKAGRALAPLRITDVEIRNDAGGAPRLRARTKRAAVAGFFRRYETKVSLTHTDDLAMAVVILLQKKGG